MRLLQTFSLMLKMEDIKKVLEQNKIILTSSSDDDSDCDSISAYQTKNCKKIINLKSLTMKKRNGERRLPTRKPDPNVYNRNALLARENRRKKKVYLETIEKELDVVRKANRNLAKALGRQINISESLKKEKQYFENIVKSKFEILAPVNDSSFQHIHTEENPFTKRFGDIMDITRSRSSSSLNEPDNRSMILDGLSDGSVVAPKNCSGNDFSSIDFSFPEFSTDLYDSTEAITSSTWGDNEYNVDNFISTNLTILQHGADMQSLTIDHCYARYPTESKSDSSDQESEPSDYIDVEGVCSTNGQLCESCYIFPTYHTPPSQLLKKQSS